ncbi:SDR family oxidoreductase [Corticibacter populi]|uniref:SDR family oxidoreductase n=1 Tax=Corticibacter populi TaxID=1550736 RepID=A0A3M6QV31_9BURK|nr:SDR family oxidoreductase [Corticibacter populi]RMX06876.1 SDR family oxidoreductase [Corticibacter populi]RZS31530.1 NAD(P)-dependent dehydrogenase (short-subunit alcohol dehydrogenase family) [Corticibacter populi]
MSHSFDQQRILVVGGSSGLGEAAAKAFAQAGAQVVIASRNQQHLDAAAARIGAGVTHPVQTAVLDTTDDASVEAYFAQAGSFDHVVVTAAQTPGGLVRELPLADAYSAMNSKFWGAYRVARVASIRERGTLTFISGFLSVRPGNWVLQGAINAALEALARGLALELAPQKVRVNAVSPGMIATPLWSGMPEAERQKMYENAAATLPARVTGQPEDIANAILFLASTPYATGSTVLVDGGAAIA